MRGDFCRLSHDMIPFPYCPQYNDVGKCDLPHCNFIHRLYEYIPPEHKAESEKREYPMRMNRMRDTEHYGACHIIYVFYSIIYQQQSIHHLWLPYCDALCR